MSEQKKGKERKILPNELKYIEAMSDLLANESGMNKDWIKSVLLLTIPRSLLPTHSEDYKKYPVRLLYQFRPCLLEAMKWMNQDTVQELFSGDLSHLHILETNYKNLISEVPFINFEVMLPMANQFQAYLEEETKSIIKTGNPSKHFDESSYLEKTFLSSFTQRTPDSISKIPKEKYLARHEEFSGGLLSQSFLEKALGPQFYREFIEIELQPALVFTPERLAKNDDLVRKLKENLRPLLGYRSLTALKHYLTTNKLRIPADLDERDETFRANLHLFSQNAFKKIVGLHRAKKGGSILKEISKLIYTMPHEHLDLIFNGHLGYFGLGEYDFGDQTLYIYGRKLLLNILTAAALADESNREILADIKYKLEPVIEDFINPDTGDLAPITYSLYQAIELCSYNDVVWACGQLSKAKEKLNDIKKLVKQKTGEVLKFSYDQLKAINDETLLQEYLGRTGGVDDIKTLRSLRDAATIRDRFDENFTEYRCLNSAYGIFDFSTTPRSAAIEVMFNNYQAGEKRTSVRELVYAIYQNLPEKEKEAKLLLKGNSIWRLEKGPLKDHDAVKYGMVRSGAKKFGIRAYILDFSFEDRSPEEQIKILKTKQKDRDDEIKSNYKEKLKKKIEKRKIREAEEASGTRRKFGDMGGKKNSRNKKSK